MLLEKDELSSKQNDVASTFKQHLGSIKDSLNLILGSKILKYITTLTVDSIIYLSPLYKSIKEKIQS